MNNDMKKKVSEYLSDRVTVFGFAPVDSFDDAPEKHHPANVCKDAKTVVVFGIAMPRGMIHSPDYNLHTLHRSYHSVYVMLDEIGLGLSNHIEEGSESLAVPVPAYAPLVYHENEPWGILSLKHAAVNAGLGAFGINGLVHNSRFGTLLRFGAVVTNAELPPDPLVEEDPCPSDCRACQNACPVHAINGKGSFKKMLCLRHTIKHAVYPIAIKNKEDMKHLELITNTLGYNYWMRCDECLKTCPNNYPEHTCASTQKGR